MGTSTNTPIVLSILGFYVFIFVMFGLIGIETANAGKDLLNTPEVSYNILDLLGTFGYFISGIGITLSSLPGWVNTLIFLPPGIALAYIALSWVRGTA